MFNRIPIFDWNPNLEETPPTRLVQSPGVDTGTVSDTGGAVTIADDTFGDKRILFTTSATDGGSCTIKFPVNIYAYKRYGLELFDPTIDAETVAFNMGQETGNGFGSNVAARNWGFQQDYAGLVTPGDPDEYASLRLGSSVAGQEFANVIRANSGTNYNQPKHLRVELDRLTKEISVFLNDAQVGYHRVTDNSLNIGSAAGGAFIVRLRTRTAAARTMRVRRILGWVEN